MAQEHYLGHTVVDDARREWEVYRYLRPLKNLIGTPGYPAAPKDVTGPVASHDRALTAFAQLGALRLNARRSVISLFDRREQHIVAESTRTISLQNDQIHEPEDDLWLGALSVPRGDNPCSYAAGLLIPPEFESRSVHDDKDDQDYVVFPNLENIPRFHDQPFVRDPKPHGRFYAGVPIVSPDGLTIGVYCVLDDKPREGLSPGEISFLKDMATTVMAHLIMVRAKDELNRSQNMVQGLSEFQHNQPSYTQRNCTPDSPPKTKKRKDHNRRASANTTQYNESQQCNVRSTCQRAAKIIREVTDLDGVVILDASVPSYSPRYTSRERAWSMSSSNSDQRFSPVYRGSVSDESGNEKCCDVLGSSLACRSAASPLPAVISPSSPRESFLRNLLRKYPNGKIWTHDTMTDTDMEGNDATSDVDVPESAREEFLECKILRKLFPGFHSLAIVGLRHNAGSRWFGASVAWTCAPTRILSEDSELAYLIAFGSSILSELARLDVKVADQAKTAFISSISHELRTPLHGIMGSLECLQSTQMDESQIELLSTIDTCNQTLLDIFDNLLSFSKTDKFVNNNRRIESDYRPPMMEKNNPPTMANVDLRALVEGVIETILAGRKFAHRDRGEGHDESNDSQVNLLLDFDGAHDKPWNFHTQAGGWRRLVLNLVTNGLKYTEQGSVSVRLSSKPLAKSADLEKSQVTLTVADTGKGMSPEFLRLQLFSPFVQEDPLAHGTGLGLSICKDIVTSMDGEIEVTSEQNTGSTFQISMVLTHSAPHTVLNQASSPTSLLTGKCRKDHLKIGRASAFNALDLKNQQGTFESLFTHQCISWLGLTTSISYHANNEDFLLVTEDELSRLSTPPQKPLLVARSIYAPSNIQVPAGITTHVEFLTQPWTPAKLARAIYNCMNSTQTVSCVAIHSNDGVQAQALIEKPLTPQSSSNSSPSPDSSSGSVTTVEAPEVSVLLVDDNPVNLRLLAAFMKKQKYHYDTAVNGFEAVELYKSFADSDRLGSYKYILLDVQMPVMDGLEACRQIREYESGAGLKPCSVVMLTGAGSQEIQQEAFASGADLFLTKPVKMKLLGQALEDLA